MASTFTPPLASAAVWQSMQVVAKTARVAASTADGSAAVVMGNVVTHCQRHSSTPAAKHVAAEQSAGPNVERPAVCGTRVVI